MNFRAIKIMYYCLKNLLMRGQDFRGATFWVCTSMSPRPKSGRRSLPGIRRQEELTQALALLLWTSDPTLHPASPQSCLVARFGNMVLKTQLSRYIWWWCALTAFSQQALYISIISSQWRDCLELCHVSRNIAFSIVNKVKKSHFLNLSGTL